MPNTIKWASLRRAEHDNVGARGLGGERLVAGGGAKVVASGDGRFRRKERSQRHFDRKSTTTKSDTPRCQVRRLESRGCAQAVLIGMDQLLVHIRGAQNTTNTYARPGRVSFDELCHKLANLATEGRDGRVWAPRKGRQIPH